MNKTEIKYNEYFYYCPNKLYYSVCLDSMAFTFYLSTNQMKSAISTT